MNCKSRCSNPNPNPNPNPKLSANILSKLTFSWLIPLFWYGRKNNLEEKDVYDVLPENESDNISEVLGRSWYEEVKNSKKNHCKPSLLKAVARTFFWPSLYYASILSMGQIVLSLLQPIVIEVYVKYFDTKPSIWIGIGSATLVVLMFIAISCVLVHSQFKLQELGMRAKIACSGLIYRKMTRLSYSAMARIDEGHIINLLSTDVLKWENFFVYVHFSWILPVQLLGVIYIMVEKAEAISIVGISVIVLQTLPVQGLFNRLIYKFRLKAAKVTDRRILLIKEVFNGIKLIKMYNWEEAFEKFIVSLRKCEVKWLKLLAYTKAISMSVFAIQAHNALFVTSLTYFIIEGKLMTSESIYGCWRYFIILQLVSSHLPLTVTSISEIRAAVKRIETFLLLDEIRNKIQYNSIDDDKNKPRVSIQQVSVSWDTESTTNILSDINVQMFHKQLYVIVGPAGAGKSSLLKLILGELQPSAGSVSINGKISYSSQEPWLFSGSVRSNILFGEPYDEIRYKNVVNACALSVDFNQLPYSDKTLVGDGGSVLSGGQRSRINLARALYREADIYLLDDCLSAVDVSVGKVLYEKCFKGILKEKTCVLVTHNVLHSVEEDQILFMKEGKIDYQGTFANLERNVQYSLYLTAQKNKLVFEQKISAKTEICNENVRISSRGKEDKEPSETDKFISHTNEPRETEELMVKGKIAINLYWRYFKAGGSYWKLFAIAFTAMLTQVFLCLTDLHISYISTISSANYIISTNGSSATWKLSSENSNDEIHRALYKHGFLIACSVITIFIRSFSFFIMCLNANKNIHNKMFIRLLRAPLSFFYVNNIGRIINRFSQDTGSVDNQLAELLLYVIQSIIFFFALTLLICMTKWWIIFPMALAIVACIKIQHIYQKTARDVRRLEGVAKGPVFSHVNSSFAGLLTIRSCQLTELNYEKFVHLQNQHTSAYYLVLAGMTIANFWTEHLKNILIAIISYGLLFSSSSSSSVNFIFTQVFFLLSLINQSMKYFTETLVQMVNIERMFQFTEVDQENTPQNYPVKTLTSWPSRGCIQIYNLSLKYLETAKPVLKNLNFNIKAGQRVGIVGRTGAGKSSLIAALFRLVDFDGCIYIDNVNIKKLGIPDVRSKISIIPQDCLLFTISLRDNLDPNSEYSDEVIWSALTEVGLGSTYNSLSVLIDKKQLSMGQMQLLSLARVILKKNKILVLDEATANVDNETDATVLNVIKNKFKDCTIISIAHRLNTIIDSDKVLVMNDGQILEFDNPYILLKKDDGVFRKMALQSDNAHGYENLEKIAKDVWIKKGN